MHKSIYHVSKHLSRTGHKLYGLFGEEVIELEAMDWIIIGSGLSLLLFIIIFFCYCLPPHKSKKEWDEIAKQKEEAIYGPREDRIKSKEDEEIYNEDDDVEK